jgi:hypothetical protein
MVENGTDVSTDLIVTEENKEGTILNVTTSKRKSMFTIYKPTDGYSMFKIKSESGSMPEHLSGYYTNRKTALADLTYWLVHTPESREAKWDRMFGEEKAPPPKLKEKKSGTTAV